MAKKAKPSKKCFPQWLPPDAEIIRHMTRRKYRRRKPEWVQPDYGIWQQIKVGMSRAQVVGLLGPTLQRHGWPRHDGPYAHYGHLELPLAPSRPSYMFTIGYDRDDRVWSVSDPFGGSFSSDGKPSKPMLIIPQQRTRFDHYPRVVDVRWWPASGVYPIEYAVEGGIAQPGSDQYRDWAQDIGLLSPYCFLCFPGCQPCRVRVRGSNELGDGEWSDYRYFTFDI
jgi:hypothetical protein